MSESSCQALIYSEKPNKIDKLWQFQDPDMERQLRKDGGILTLEDPRQGYFLGELVAYI